MDIVFLCQNVYKKNTASDSVDSHCKFSLLDIMIKNPKQLYDYILLKELYGYKFTGDILEETKNKSIKIKNKKKGPQDTSKEYEIYLQDVEGRWRW